MVWAHGNGVRAVSRDKVIRAVVNVAAVAAARRWRAWSGSLDHHRRHEAPQGCHHSPAAAAQARLQVPRGHGRPTADGNSDGTQRAPHEA